MSMAAIAVVATPLVIGGINAAVQKNKANKQYKKKEKPVTRKNYKNPKPEKTQQAKISPSLVKEKTPTQEEQDASLIQTVSRFDSPEEDYISDPRKREHMKLRKNILENNKISTIYLVIMKSLKFT